MNILIPMAGLGKRFSDAGYTDIKPLIPMNGIPMAVRAINSLGLETGPHGHYIFVIRNFDGWEKLDKILTKAFPKSFVLLLDKETDGPARTCLKAVHYIDNREPLVIANCDQIMHWDGQLFQHFCQHTDGAVVTYNSNRPQNSYIKLGEDGYGVELAEKKVISNISLIGVHYWKEGREFVSSALRMIANNDRAPNGEFYVAPTYNYSISAGLKIATYHLPDGVYNSVGSPEDLEQYLGRSNEAVSTK